jgi:AcrR family transcriptional regulator
MKEPTAKKLALMDAAKEIAAHHGLRNATTAEIARKASVAEGTIFRHFKSKEELFSAIYEEALDQAKASMLEGTRWQDPPEERVVAYLARLMKYFIERQIDFLYVERFMLTTNEAHDRLEQILMAESREEKDYPLLGAIQNAQQEGLVKPIPIRDIMALLIGPVLQKIKRTIVLDESLEEKNLTDFSRACWDAIKI